MPLAAQSKTQIKMPTTITVKMTTIVLFIVCLPVGHATFFSSLFISRSQRPMRSKKLGLALPFLDALSEEDFAACSIFSFSAIVHLSSLLRLVVDGVLPAEGAVLFQLQTVGGIFLVLHGVVISLLTLRAPQGDLDARTGFACHMFGTSFKFSGRSGIKKPGQDPLGPDPAT